MDWTKLDDSQWKRNADGARVWWFWKPGRRATWRAEHGDGTRVENEAGRAAWWWRASTAMVGMDEMHPPKVTP